jgi:hypothetical protein
VGNFLVSKQHGDELTTAKKPLPCVFSLKKREREKENVTKFTHTLLDGMNCGSKTIETIDVATQKKQKIREKRGKGMCLDGDVTKLR